MTKFNFNFSFSLFRMNRRNNAKESRSFFTLAHETINTLVGVRAKSTVDNYLTALRSFCRYAGSDLSVDRIDNHLIEGYQQWLIDMNVMHNTISCYMRSLRSLIHRMSVETKNKRLFDMIFTGRMRTDKRSITMEDIARIRDLPLPVKSSMVFSRDIFLFSFYALGMPFVDIAFLHKSQVCDGYIVYHRHKTGQRVRVRLEQPMQIIIDRYATEGTPYVFPILSAQNKKRLMTEYESARSRYNRHLRRMGKMVGLSRTLTSYVARHSWASVAYHANVELSVISKALGHASPNTTLTYIREIDDNRIDQANHRLLAELK